LEKFIRDTAESLITTFHWTVFLVVFATEELMHCDRSRILLTYHLFCLNFALTGWGWNSDFKCGSRSNCKN